MVKITGQLKNPLGSPIGGCQITLRAINNSEYVITKSKESAITDENGNYSFDVEPASYDVFFDKISTNSAGVITVYTDSKSASINDYLINFNASETTPTIILTLQQIKEDVKSYSDKSLEYSNSASSSSDNAKTYQDNAKTYSDNAKTYQDNAKDYQDNANTSASNASKSEKNAKTYQDNASTSETNAETYKDNAKASADDAKTSADNAKTYADNAKTSETNASTSATTATTKATEAANSATNASNSSIAAKSMAKKLLDMICPIGKIEPMPFSANELPDGWYEANGAMYDLTSYVGKTLNALSDDYKTNFGIVATETQINIPNMFYSDGRGYFVRFVDGTTKKVGVVENDRIRNIKGTVYASNKDGSGRQTSDGAFITEEATDYQYAGHSTYAGVIYNLKFDASKSDGVLTGEENSPLYIGFLPAIFLGVEDMFS